MTAGIAANKPIAVAIRASAIPAVVAYNKYSDQVDRLLGRYENFMEEFTTVLQRQSQKQTRSEIQKSEQVKQEAGTEQNDDSATEVVEAS